MKKRKSKEKKIVNYFEFIPEEEFDYHVLGELTTYDIERYLNEFLEDCYISKMSRVLIITGKGHVVRPMVLRLLKSHQFVEKFKDAGYFNGQSGAVEIVLKN